MPETSERLGRLVETLGASRDPAKASGMSDYMRGLFPFLGVPSPERKHLTREWLTRMPPLDEKELLALADELWALPEREFQYVACDLLRRHSGVLTPSALPALERLIVTKPWWDTVDALATNVVGSIALRFPEARPQMDAWRDSQEIWLVRTALLHQERWRDRTDPDWLFAACAQHAGNRDFFIRKAIGWALRSYARTDPAAVREFLEAQGERLSGLSRREALRGVRRAES